MTESPQSNEVPADVSPAVWLWLPLPVVVAAITLGAYCKNSQPLGSAAWKAQVDWYGRWFHGEASIIEVGTAIALIAACFVGALAVKRSRMLEQPWIRRWLLVLLAGTFYFAGEEVSWGQHLIGWTTPQWYNEATSNRQQETNLHNINGWFNQKPRHLFQAWVVIGGIFVALASRRREVPKPVKNDFRYWFWPTSACTLTAILAMAVRAPEWITEAMDLRAKDPLYHWLTAAPPSETQEFCLGIFLLIYFWSINYRMRQLPDAPA